MASSPEISELLLDILRTGILRIRSAAWSGDASRCAVEADHIHNLPDLIRNFSPDRLKYYWEVERTCFVDQSSPADLASFEALWTNLASCSFGSKDQILTA